ncbi:hypothetical protein [Avibacterium paragallinarum]|uniref:Uncharacterized protein n=1 Tax=Avibacterium paragallinarum TaxID=728 RepID=A0A380Z3F8_AVIPA|nr:hypothetical protein [Avibacterium paragallinarum]SUV40758.1 Uncharacterised protein [Avibacterium paragallinarum]
MKVSKENQEWIKQYAQIHQLTEEEAVNKLLVKCVIHRNSTPKYAKGNH